MIKYWLTSLLLILHYLKQWDQRWDQWWESFYFNKSTGNVPYIFIHHTGGSIVEIPELETQKCDQY